MSAQAPLPKPHHSWSKAKRIDAAIKGVLDFGATQTESAKFYGVNRQYLNKKVQEHRQRRDDKVEAARLAVEQDRVPMVREKRRIPETLNDFVDTYFTNWVCPDCQVHHEVPWFHEEISEAIRNPDNRRILVNVPPYHSKTTVMTVWDTVMDIAEDPNLRTAVVSKTQKFGEAVLFSIKTILTDPSLYDYSRRNLIEDYGPFIPEGMSTWNAQEIYVTGRTGAEKDPTVLALGVGSQIYGRRFDKIKFDDIATLENMRNPERAAQIIEWIDKEALSRIGKRGMAIWAGTRVAPGDIYYTLGKRPGYVVIRYPALFDDEAEDVLWPDHFPYSQVLIHRSEMKPADFQLIYQNVDIPGLGASFTQEMIDLSKDTSRVAGHWQRGWRLVAGLDPAGANKASGYTAFACIAIDLDTGKRFLVDSYAERQMRAPAIRDKIFEWTSAYPIYEWRVEANGLQSQIVQYNEEIVRWLAQRGVRVVPHQTQGNKWDPQFGVESLAPLLANGMFSIPWGNAPSAQRFQPLLEEMVAFPMGVLSDRLMALWFAELGVRDQFRRAHLPLFNSRMRVPERIKRRRRILDFESREVRPVPLHEQHPGAALTIGQAGFRRRVVGTPVEHGPLPEWEPEPEEQPMNIDPRIWSPDGSRAGR